MKVEVPATIDGRERGNCGRSDFRHGHERRDGKPQGNLTGLHLAVSDLSNRVLGYAILRL